MIAHLLDSLAVWWLHRRGFIQEDGDWCDSCGHDRKVHGPIGCTTCPCEEFLQFDTDREEPHID